MLISYDFSSPNFDKRPSKSSIDFVILHYTELPFSEALSSYCNPHSKLSPHYFIKEDGKIFQLVSDEMRAWHAGRSYWGGCEALNDCSIGIEIDNLGTGPFTDPQMDACVHLCKSLASKYNIPGANIMGHSDIAPHRKLDPGIYFDWNKLAQHGLGIIAKDHNNPIMTDTKSLQIRLESIGYDIDITGEWDERTNAVVRAFQSHFCQNLLREKGLEFYRDINSKYSWNKESEKVLSGLEL